MTTATSSPGNTLQVDQRRWQWGTEEGLGVPETCRTGTSECLQPSSFASFDLFVRRHAGRNEVTMVSSEAAETPGEEEAENQLEGADEIVANGRPKSDFDRLLNDEEDAPEEDVAVQ